MFARTKPPTPRKLQCNLKSAKSDPVGTRDLKDAAKVPPIKKQRSRHTGQLR